jgi:hypothetical protein
MVVGFKMNDWDLMKMKGYALLILTVDRGTDGIGGSPTNGGGAQDQVVMP